MSGLLPAFLFLHLDSSCHLPAYLEQFAVQDNRAARDVYCISIQQTKETRMDSATVSPSAQSRCSHGPVRNKSRCVSPTCQKIPVCIIHTCSLHVVFKAGLAGLIRDCTRYRRPVTRPFSMDLARDPSDRSDPLYERSREDHHAQIADCCTLTFPISH